MSIKTNLKGALLPSGRHSRRLPMGIGRGLRLEIDFEYQTNLYLGLYEVELNRHLRAIARPGYRSFDIGGAYGYDALVLAKLTGGDVVSVEVEREYADRIRANVAANPRLPSIEVVEAFVSDSDVPGNVTIDSMANRFFVPDLLKIDIEGAELAALRGATRVLAERKPAILLEVHGRELEWDCLEILRDAGYDPPTVTDRRRWLVEQRPLEHNRWLIFEG